MKQLLTPGSSNGAVDFVDLVLHYLPFEPLKLGLEFSSPLAFDDCRVQDRTNYPTELKFGDTPDEAPGILGFNLIVGRHRFEDAVDLFVREHARMVIDKP